MTPVFFLKSKRFWSMPEAWIVGTFGGRAAELGLELDPGALETTMATLATIAVWLFGMWQGKRPVAIVPPKQTDRGDGPAMFVGSHWGAGLAVLGLALLLAACPATLQDEAPDTPQGRLLAVEADFNTAFVAMRQYEDLPRCDLVEVVICSEQEVVVVLRGIGRAETRPLTPAQILPTGAGWLGGGAGRRSAGRR